MITHDAFYPIRLSQFMAPEQIDERVDWEYYDEVWVGEGYIFTDVLQLERDPWYTRAISIDLIDCPAADLILSRLDLPLRAAMGQAAVDRVLGMPRARERMVADRYSVEYTVDTPDAYTIDCTFLDKGGLVWVVILVRDDVFAPTR